MRGAIVVWILGLAATVQAADVVAPAVDLGAFDAATLPPDPDAPTVGVSIDRTEGALGDRLNLTISATSKEGIVVTLPASVELGKFEVLTRDDGNAAGLDVGNGRRARRFSLGIASYEIGTHAIPEIRLSYISAGGQVRFVDTEPLLITITGVIGPNEKPEPQPLRAVRSTMVEDVRAKQALQYGAIGFAALVALLVIRAIVRRLLRKRAAAAAVAPPPRPADEVAMERLQVLRARGNFANDSYRPYYFELAEILREFLGSRFKFYALELTTRELLMVLGDTAPALAAHDGEIARFLEDADLVKYAKFGSDDVAAERAFNFVQATVLANALRLEVPPATPPVTVKSGGPGED